MLQRGYYGSGEGQDDPGRHSFSAASNDTDRWLVCGFLPTSTVQGVNEFVNRKGLRRHKLCRHKCVRESSTAAACEDTHNCYFCHIVSNDTRVQFWLWKLHPLAFPCTSQSACYRRAPTADSTCYAHFQHNSLKT